MQPWTKYLRQTLVLCVIGHCGKSSISIFQEFFASIEKWLFWEDDGALDNNSISFEIFLILPNYSFCNSFGSSYIPCLLLIITFRFTCGERKIWPNMKKSQNIMIATAGDLKNLANQGTLNLRKAKYTLCFQSWSLVSNLLFEFYLEPSSIIFYSNSNSKLLEGAVMQTI